MSKPVTVVSAHDPMRKAWDFYTGTDDYESTRKWALHEEHVDGSLWAAFCAGWEAARHSSDLMSHVDKVMRGALLDIADSSTPFAQPLRHRARQGLGLSTTTDERAQAEFDARIHPCPNVGTDGHNHPANPCPICMGWT